MRNEVKKVIKEYLNMGGEQVNPEDFIRLQQKVALELLFEEDKETRVKLIYIKYKLKEGLAIAERLGYIKDLEIDDTAESIEQKWQDWQAGKKGDWEGADIIGKVKPVKKKAKEELGKLVDVGETPYPDRSDEYWKERVKMKFDPKKTDLRRGSNVPGAYLYYDPIFIKEYYDLKSIAFGNWVSQEDRWNYIAALGIGLYDLNQVLGFRPQQISLSGHLSVAFGARGRGSAVAHFELQGFVINITRYSRKDKKNKSDYLTSSAGMGAFAHEYAHALDYYGGTYLRKSKGGALSEGRSRRVKPHKKLMAEDNAAGHMERLLNKIIWKNEKTHSNYYKRLLDNKLKPYYFQRNELFARAFEVYIHAKMQKRKYFNIFLAERKYQSETYLTPSEIKPLEKDFDKLLNAIKWKIKNS